MLVFYFKRGSERDRSNHYARYTLEAFMSKNGLSERVSENVVQTKTVGERKTHFKFNAPCMNHPSRARALPNSSSNYVVVVSEYPKEQIIMLYLDFIYFLINLDLEWHEFPPQL